MITRFRAKAERECTTTSSKHNPTSRSRKEASSEHTAPHSLERADMGRRGGNSGRSTRSKPVDLSDVAPVQLFPMAEEDTTEDDIVSRVSFN